MKSIILRIGIVSLPLLTTVAHAASGTWTNPAGGSWTNAVNWASGIVADGPGYHANFTRLTLPGDATVTLDGSRTIGSLSFDDLDPSRHDWLLAGGSGGFLTLSSTTPTVTVFNGTTTVSAPVSGTAGLRKFGTGRLVLAARNTYTGPTTVSVGRLGIFEATFTASSPLSLAGVDAVVESGGTLNLGVNASGTSTDIYGPGTVRLTGTTNGVGNPDIYFGPDHSANNYWGCRIASRVDLGEAQRFIFGRTGHNGVGRYGLGNADCQFAETILGSGGMTMVGQMSWTGSGPMEVPFALNASNAFTGPVEIRRGSVYLGHPEALVRQNVLKFNPAAGHNARLFLYGNNAWVSDLSSSGGGSVVIANGNLKTGAGTTLGGVTLLVEQTQETAFGGVITDAFLEYAATGTGTTGPLNLSKTGPGRLTLSGLNDYTGSTVVSNGVLQIDGAVGNGSVTIYSGGALAGNGTIEGPVSIRSGANLMPGADGLGTLTINDALSLNGTTVLELKKTGTALESDRLAGVSLLTCGGLLVVTNIGDVHTGALAPGESFMLFEADAVAGSFDSVILPPLPAGLTWDAADLTVNGRITVVESNGSPVLVVQPQSITAGESSSISLSVTAAGTRPLAFQWYKSGAVLPGATGTAFTLTSAVTNDTGGYHVVVTNNYGSVTSALAQLTIFPAGQFGTLTNGLVIYLNFDGNISAQASTTNGGVLYPGGATLGPRYTAGVIDRAATFANAALPTQPNDWAISLGNLEWIYAGSFSISLWERTPQPGDDALMGNKNWTSGANVGWVISSLDLKNLNYNAVGGTRRDIDLQPPFSDGNWHLLTFTFDRAANQVISYVDGQAVNTSDISPSGSASFNAGFNTLVGSTGNGLYSATADIDDLGVWSRVLTTEEVSGIYAAGLSGKPLTMAIPGRAPTITAQPVSVNTTEGMDVMFSVTATGSGVLTYQWRLNGTDIPGATNAVMVVSAASAGNQGTYTVLVNSGSGAVVSAGAVLSVYPLEVTGQWDFDYGDLRATVGADLEFRGNAALMTSFPFLSVAGSTARGMHFGPYGVQDGLYLRHGAKPNGGGRFVNQYTLVMDIMFPGSSIDQWRALFQSDPFNHLENDAEFYVGDGASLPAANGIGTDGQFNGTLAPNTWYRIAFAVDLTAASGEHLSTYVNGVKVGSRSLTGGVDGRYALGPAAVLFTSGLTGGTFTQPGYVNSIQFVNGWMSSGAIASLGLPDADGLPPGNAAFKILGLAQNSSMVTLEWTGPDGVFHLLKSASLTNPVWEEEAAFTNTRTVTLPVTGPTSFYRLSQLQPDIKVGQLAQDEQALPSKQVIRPAGAQVQFAGRPVDLALSLDSKTLYVKNQNGLVVIDAGSWTVRQTLSYPGGGASTHGIAVNAEGSRVYVSGAGNQLYEWNVATNGTVSFSRTLSLPGGSYPCGIALSADGSKAYVCLSIANKLAEVNLNTGALVRQISVGIAPWDVVLSTDGATAYVSDWGGRFPAAGDLTAPSAGTPVVVDERGVASSGTVSVVNLTTGLRTAQVTTDLHPSDLELSADGTILFVANANSDTVSIIDTQTRNIRESLLARPDSTFPYGSAANGLSLSRDGKSLFVASAGNNAVAVFELPNEDHTNSVLRGFLPTDWYPGAVVADSNHLYVVNVKGLGSRQGQPVTTTWSIGAFLGTANKIAIPDAEALSKFTSQTFEQGRVSYIRQSQQLARPGQAPVPVPARVGEPSVFKHVVYILKENKTYDQVFGDMPEGNGEPSLCIYPEFVTPNHHTLAREYVLLDNFYCNGVNSADGHSWSTEGNVTDHLEKSFGGFSRSYTFGDDPLTYSSTGFIWNNVLQHGLTFRNYGEMDYASTSPAASWLQIYQDYTNGTGAIRYVQNIGIDSLRPYSSTNVPGWNMGIPDVVRAAGFIKELNEAQAKGVWESFHLLYLPNDHTGGPPSARAQVADNDLALGQVVEAITHSAFASNTVIFVIEDDPQSGYDHVDGHRSICLVISPYTKRGEVISTFYNQAGVLHTMEQILGIPPMTQQDAMAPLMFECFTKTPNFTAYTCLPNNVPLTEGVSGTASLTPKQQFWAKRVQAMDLTRPDRIDDDAFNRYIWHSIKGDTPYPAKFVGAHGRGLKRLGLLLDKSLIEDDD